jgi:hypothetical protein
LLHINLVCAIFFLLRVQQSKPQSRQQRLAPFS